MWLSRKISALSGIRWKYLHVDFYERTLLDPLGPSMHLQTVPGGDAFCVLLHQIKFQPTRWRVLRTLLTSVVSFNAIAILIILNQRPIHESICFFRLALVFQG